MLYRGGLKDSLTNTLGSSYYKLIIATLYLEGIALRLTKTVVLANLSAIHLMQVSLYLFFFVQNVTLASVHQCVHAIAKEVQTLPTSCVNRNVDM